MYCEKICNIIGCFIDFKASVEAAGVPVAVCLFKYETDFVC